MSTNLDAMHKAIVKHLEAKGMVVFYAFPRPTDPSEAIYWDTAGHPDVGEFLSAAEAAGARVVSVHAGEFTEEMLEDAHDRLEEAALEREDRRNVETVLKEMKSFLGFICEVEASFDVAQHTYIYATRTEWFDELNDTLDRIDEARRQEDEEPLGGQYFSRN